MRRLIGMGYVRDRVLGGLLTAVLVSPLLTTAVASANDFRPRAGDRTTRACIRPQRMSRRAARARSLWRRAQDGRKFRRGTASSGFNSTESTLNTVNVPSLKRKWHAATGGAIESSPAVANGIVYVGSDDHSVYAFDEKLGTKKWSYKTGGMVTSSPAIFGGVVYVGSEDGDMYALNAATGKLVWTANGQGAFIRRRTSSEQPSTSGPAKARSWPCGHRTGTPCGRSRPVDPSPPRPGLPR